MLAIGPATDAGGDGDSVPDPLAKKFLNVRTLISFAIGLAVLGIMFRQVDVNVDQIVARLKTMDLGYFVAALLLYYTTFVIRALRWRKLLENVGYGEGSPVVLPPVRGIAQIVMLSWFANCIVPAKLGDAIRAWLLKREAGVSFSKTFGTILAERIIDMLILFVLLVGSVLLAFHGALPAVILSIMQVGIVLAGVVVVGLLAMRKLGGHIERLIPKRFRAQYALFEEGTLGSFQALPLVLAYSVAGWAIEAGRLFLVCLALGLTGLSPAIVLFVALASALLTTLPVTPAGLGFVESAIVGILILAAGFGLAPGVNETVAASVAILDRVISYFSLIVVGSVLYAATHKRYFAPGL
ncbi:MAG: flippase-like domain-containing protein [Chloroflexota bacterium]|nr:flippase-like domain-containing protein [Chloroflexota bacterium]